MTKTLLLLLVTIAAGCASPPQETTRYLLRSESSTRAGVIPDANLVGIAQVRVASYLDQPGIVVETAPREVHSAHLNIWAEPLSEGVRHYLRSALSRDLGYEVSDENASRNQWSYEVQVKINEFHGTLSGEARLVAAWSIVTSASSEPVRGLRHSDSETLSEPGYAGLVDAQTRLLDRLAARIAVALRELQAHREATGIDDFID